MALKLLQPGCNPLGQFDCVDSELTAFKGGEICTFKYVTAEAVPGVGQSGLDLSAYDDQDGYVNNFGVFKRPAVTKTFAASSMTARPLMLSDDGVAGYGTLFGTVVGGAVGQTTYGINTSVPSSALLGPHTALGSGKMTLWDKPGLYAVSLDAVDTTASTGLVPTNTNLAGGDNLGFTIAGALTPSGSGSAVTNGGTAISVGHLVEFNTNGSLVTTPNYLVAALNSPSGNVSSVQTRGFTFATIYFAPQSN